MSYPPPSHRSSRSAPPPRPRSGTTGEPYRSSRLRTATRSGGLQRRVLQAEAPEGDRPVPGPTTAAAEWLWLLRAGINRERLAMTIGLTAAFIATLVVVVIPAITGQFG